MARSGNAGRARKTPPKVNSLFPRQDTSGVASALVAVAKATLPMSLAAGFIGMSLCGGLLLIGLSRSQPLIA